MYFRLHIHKRCRSITRTALVSETTNIISCDASTSQAVVFITYFRYLLRSDRSWNRVRVIVTDTRFLNWVMLQVTSSYSTAESVIAIFGRVNHLGTKPGIQVNSAWTIPPRVGTMSTQQKPGE